MIWSSKTKEGKTRWHARRGHGEQRTFDRKADAQDWEDDGRRAKQNAKAGVHDEDAGPILFRDLVELWEDNFSPSTWRLEMVRYSVDRWGDTLVRQIKPQGLGAWLHNLTGKNGQPLSEKTKSHVLETLRRVLNAGVEWGYLPKSPARPGAFKAPSPKKRVREIRPFESWTEVLRVTEHLSPAASALVRFCAATGARCPSEVIDLDWKQIDLKNKKVRINGTKTENAPREVPLSNLALEALNSLPRNLSGRVFAGKKGGRFDYRTWRRFEWRHALRLAGLDDRTPYETRHTFATLALQAGASLDEVAAALGHSDISVTRDHYRKWTPQMDERLRRILNTIGAEEVEEGTGKEHDRP